MYAFNGKVYVVSAEFFYRDGGFAIIVFGRILLVFFLILDGFASGEWGVEVVVDVYAIDIVFGDEVFYDVEDTLAHLR